MPPRAAKPTPLAASSDGATAAARPPGRGPDGRKAPAAGKGAGAKKGAKPGKPAAGKGRDDLFAKLGLTRLEDFALHLPIRYEDETRAYPAGQAPLGAPVVVEGRVADVNVQYRPRRQLVVRLIGSGGREAWLRFLNFYGSQTQQFETARDNGRLVRAFGEVRPGFFGPELVHPRIRVVDDGEALPDRLTPVYPTTAGISQPVLRKRIAVALTALRQAGGFAETLPEAVRADLGLPSLDEALTLLHAPPPEDDFAAQLDELSDRHHPAWRRVQFDELLAQQLCLRRAHAARRAKDSPALNGAPTLTAALLRQLPFALTGAQQRVWDEIAADLAQGHPMQRLLQGDVGSGKTVIGALAALRAIESGYQAAFMAPTEILAEQHYKKLRDWLEPLGIEVLWLTGSLKPKAKREMQARAGADGQLVVGTHALIQDGVEFARLGVAIVDEQHRFGVAQRLALKQKGGNPHQLMMSATPIPRTLAMTYYADLDVSVIDELPPGRTPIRTKLISDARRDEVIAAVDGACEGGRQAYWVCPLIEESEALQLQTAVDTFEHLKTDLPHRRIGLVHGRLKAEEKAAVMAAFAAHELDVLVATTVIEVGVDVPNASLMVIEHAERFGLSQLHQLRGRVGRGAAESACVLLFGHPLSETARARLKVIFENTDGFAIAREDLHLRGPGEFIGHRQSGVPMLRYADLERDTDLVDAARDTAAWLIAHAPTTADAHLQRWLGGRADLLKV